MQSPATQVPLKKLIQTLSSALTFAPSFEGGKWRFGFHLFNLLQAALDVITVRQEGLQPKNYRYKNIQPGPRFTPQVQLTYQPCVGTLNW